VAARGAVAIRAVRCGRSIAMSTETHYTFGDGDVAALRLRLLAETYAPSSAALLAVLGKAGGGVLDLGCGPGHTTELLAAALRPTWTVGLDRSARLVEAARARLPALRFLVHDVVAAPFPVPPAAVVYARFLLTHLSDPVAALRGWGGALAPGGRLVLEETASLESDHPAFRRYYALVEALQAHYGQRMRVGAEFAALAAAAGLTPERAGVVVLELPPERMAALHALNLRTWGEDPFARTRLDAAELAALRRALERVAAGQEAAGPVRSAMGQAILRAG
jgi:trans-aconitate 2-methyltransferase